MSTDPSRIDKWLWAARFFKTRTLAAAACHAGKVRRNGNPAKAASGLQPGDILEIPFAEGPGMRTIHILQLIATRVAPALARDAYEETTPAEMLEHNRQWHLARRDAPIKGRPTKKDRRALGKIRGFFD